jgi:hypothetical protein
MKYIAIIFLVISGSSFAEKEEVSKAKAEIKSFPWELVIDRGKVNGCLYDNKFYSNGSILIEETLPRKCKIDPNRDGYWAELDERELQLFEESIRAQQELDAESIGIGKLSKYETAIVRIMRKSSQR